MIVCSFNARGLGSRVKRRKICDVVTTENIDFLSIQETKMEVISDCFIRSLWESSDCDWAYLPTVGNSGRILSIWNKVKASLVFTFIGDGFVGGVSVPDVYKRQSDILMSKMGFGEGLWCVMGDFNSVIDHHERRGLGVNVDGGRNSEMAGFDTFLNSLELIDLPLIGRRFTWFHPNGVSMSRLDRMLISSSWFDVWGAPSVWVLSRDVADHCPFVLRYSSFDWGPKPFRFNNFWLQNRDFKEVVTKAWESQQLEGWIGFRLKERFKGLKVVIKEWSRITHGVDERKKKTLISEIMALDL
ncbi:endonuclease/exonuclease/phosphatase family protein, partial [Trifolium medium]|nr:endonuclease/exonuclease/phosphatase family protein [Trifolium medium]